MLSWGWIGKSKWPDFRPGLKQNLGPNGNGCRIEPDCYREVEWLGRAPREPEDHDDDDTPDQVRIGQECRTVKEVATYEDCTLVSGGTPHSVPVGVWLFEDGSFMTRVSGQHMPRGCEPRVSQPDCLGKWVKTFHSHPCKPVPPIIPQDPFVCFAAGTRIHAARGLVPVEELRAGDAVLTADHGLRPLVWTGARRVAGAGAAAPVRIAAGALGNERDLMVSQMHRMLISGWRADLMFGASEVLVPAIHLVNDRSIRLAPCEEVTYVHLMFDRHEIVFAEGIPSESFHPGATALDRVGEAVRDELLSLFPELADRRATGGLARPCLSAHEARVLMAEMRGRLR